jgi:hypothetical protein
MEGIHMKQASLLIVLFCMGLFGCTFSAPTPSVEEISITMDELEPTIPVFTPASALPTIPPTRTPVPIQVATSTQVPEETNIATVVAELGPHFDFAEISGVAHLDNGYFLITLEVPGELEGAYTAYLGGEEFDCMVLSQYPNRLYCTGLTDQAGKFAELKILEVDTGSPVFETELGIPPLPSWDSIQARIKLEEREKPTEFPPADSPPYPYP